MKKPSLVAFALFFLSSLTFAQNNLNVTIYNSDLGVIRDVRSMDISKGVSEIKIKDVAQRIDPTSVHVKLNGEVLEQNYQYDLVSVGKILEKYIDKNVQLISETNELIEGKLLSASGGYILQKADGGLIMLNDVSKYRVNVASLPNGLITVPTLVWTVNSASSGKQDVELSYQTGGMNWHAEYTAKLNENDTKLDMNAWVSITNYSGTTFENAKLKLVAGDVNRVQEPQRGGRMNDMVLMEKSAAPQFEEKSFFEYHIYDLQRPATISNNEIKQISLFEAENVSVTKKYLYKSGGNYYYYNNDNNQNKVAVVVEFKNSKDNNLGVPFPKGKVRLYKSDGKSVEFIGEDLVDHTPKDETIKLKVGDAFDIVAEETTTDQKKITDKVFETTYSIKIKNRKNEDVTVDVEKYLGAYWEIRNTNLEHAKKDAFTASFKVNVPKNSEKELKFTARYSY